MQKGKETTANNPSARKTAQSRLRPWPPQTCSPRRDPPSSLPSTRQSVSHSPANQPYLGSPMFEFGKLTGVMTKRFFFFFSPSFLRPKAAVDKMVALLEAPANVALLEQAKATAGEDVMQYMMVVLPTACQILSPCMSEFGFSPDQAGAMGLMQAIEKHKADPDIVAKAKALKSKFIPESLAPMLQQMMGLGGGA